MLLTTPHSWKYSWELERSFAVFQEEHGPNWQSWPTSCTNFNVAGNLSTVVLSCKNVCRQLKFSKLGSTSSFFFFSRMNSAIHTTNKMLVNQYVQHDFWGTKVFCFCLLTSNIVEKKFHAEKLVRRSLHFNLNEKTSWNELSSWVEWCSQWVLIVSLGIQLEGGRVAFDTLRGCRFQWAFAGKLHRSPDRNRLYFDYHLLCYVAALASDFATTCYVQSFVEFATICYVMAPRVGWVSPLKYSSCDK